MQARANGEVRLRWRASEGVEAVGENASLSVSTNFKTRYYNRIQSGYGALPPVPTRYTTYACQATREACAVLEEQYGKNCWFITLTLPGSTREALYEFAARSSYIVARLHQWWRDNFPGAEFITVWELQRRGALHMHVAIGGSRLGDIQTFAERMHRMWCHLLEQVSQFRNIDLFGRSGGGTWRHAWEKVRTEVKPVRKSITRYLSKYVSKAKSKSLQPNSYSPVRWWSCSRTLLAKLRERRLTYISPTMCNTTCGEWYETVAGTICGAAQATFAIANQYRPQDRCLSIWFENREAAQTAVWRALAKVDSAERIWDNMSAHKDTAPPARTGGAALSEDIDAVFAEDLSEIKPPAGGWGFYGSRKLARAG